MAAAMRGRAKGRWLTGALADMQQSSQAAAAVLQRHGCSACTDVTGFGLLGHAVEMARASRCRVAIDLAALPLLPCAAELAASGVASSLAPANARAAAAAEHAPGAEASAAYPLVFDPQTAGGLLAGVPAHRAAEALAALRAAGCVHAAIIGEMLPLDDDARPILLRA
jgi:selenide,water dikinase